MAQVLERIEQSSLLIHINSVFEMTDEKFEQFCRLNRDLRIEMTAEGDLIVMPPTGGRTGNRNFRLIQQLANWTDKDGTGVGFDSSTLFVLPSGAKRSPDAAWVRRERLEKLPDNQREKFLPLCPDFVIELRSASDSLNELHAKMREYIENGARLGWLLDAATRTVFIYRQDGTIDKRESPAQLQGESVVESFTLDLNRVWETDF